MNFSYEMRGNSTQQSTLTWQNKGLTVYHVTDGLDVNIWLFLKHDFSIKCCFQNCRGTK